jgi:REP element-mobilizing transposase RayT
MVNEIIGYHSIFGAYGFWLPNDPRGSWSREVKAVHLRPFGQPIHPGTRRSVANQKHDSALRLAAKKHLLHKNVIFTDAQIECLGRGFGEFAQQMRLAIYALAIMPDHVHLVYPRAECDAEEFVGLFKRAGSRALRKAGLHPFGKIDETRVNDEEISRVGAGAKYDGGADAGEKVPRVAAGAKQNGGVNAGAKREARLPTPWAEKAWHVYLHDEQEIQQRIRYVVRNPIKAGRPAQRWDFVTEF